MNRPEKIDLVAPHRPRVSERVESLAPSGIREFFDLVVGRSDIISLGVGEPDFVTPWSLRESAIDSIARGHTTYTSNSGLISLREKLSAYLARRFSVRACPESEILITVGASEAIDLALRATLNSGDEVIIPMPCFVAYEPLVSLAGGVPVPLHCTGADGFRVDWTRLEGLITPRTRAILINYPGNPTGATLRRDEVERLARIASQNQIVVISDEIYAEMSYDQDHVSLASIPEAADWTLLVSGFSKAFAMTGWRIGYAVGPEDLIGAMGRIHQYSIMCAPIMAQRAAEAALDDGLDDMAAMAETYEQRRNYIHSGLDSIGLAMVRPEGAFYAFPSIEKTGLSSTEFCRRLLDAEQIAVIPGVAFGSSGEGYFRASYAVGFETIDRAIAGIDRFLKSL